MALHLMVWDKDGDNEPVIVMEKGDRIQLVETVTGEELLGVEITKDSTDDEGGIIRLLSFVTEERG